MGPVGRTSDRDLTRWPCWHYPARAYPKFRSCRCQKVLCTTIYSCIGCDCNGASTGCTSVGAPLELTWWLPASAIRRKRGCTRDNAPRPLKCVSFRKLNVSNLENASVKQMTSPLWCHGLVFVSWEVTWCWCSPGNVKIVFSYFWVKQELS